MHEHKLAEISRPDYKPDDQVGSHSQPTKKYLYIAHTTHKHKHTHTHTYPKSSLFLYTLGCRTFFAVEFSPMGFLRQSLLWKKLIFSKNFCYVGWFDFLTHMCLPSSSPHLVAIILPSPCCHHPPLTLLPSSSPHLVAIILPSPCCPTDHFSLVPSACLM